MITLLLIIGFVLTLYPAAKLGDYTGSKLVQWLDRFEEQAAVHKRDGLAEERRLQQHVRI